MARIGFIVSLAMVMLLGAGCVDQKKHDALVKERATLNEQFVVVQEKNQRLMEEKLALDAQLAEVQAAAAAAKEAPATAKKEAGPIAGGDAALSTRDGNPVITVRDDILFAPGKAALTSRGKGVLAKVAELLRTQYVDGAIRVEGHTDNQPIRKTKKLYKTNWELASARALSVVHYLTDECGVSPKRIHAAAYGKHHPVSGNDTSAGRAKNRRVEIVILKGLSR